MKILQIKNLGNAKIVFIFIPLLCIIVFSYRFLVKQRRTLKKSSFFFCILKYFLSLYYVCACRECPQGGCSPFFGILDKALSFGILDSILQNQTSQNSGYGVWYLQTFFYQNLWVGVSLNKAFKIWDVCGVIICIDSESKGVGVLPGRGCIQSGTHKQHATQNGKESPTEQQDNNKIIYTNVITSVNILYLSNIFTLYTTSVDRQTATDRPQPLPFWQLMTQMEGATRPQNKTDKTRNGHRQGRISTNRETALQRIRMDKESHTTSKTQTRRTDTQITPTAKRVESANLVYFRFNGLLDLWIYQYTNKGEKVCKIKEKEANISIILFCQWYIYR